MTDSLPNSILKRADRPYFMVSFKNEVSGEYMPAQTVSKVQKRPNFHEMANAN